MASTVKRVAAAAAVTATALALSAVPAHAATNTIYNAGTVGVGVMHLWDGVYGNGSYDQVLPGGWNTLAYFSWSIAEGFYIGSGYCAQVSRRPSLDAAWTRLSDVHGPIQYQVNPAYYIKVVAYRAASSSSCV
jgi:hypothetical protein